MNKIITLFIVLLSVASNVNAQTNTGGEHYGKTLNIGVGIGYYGYIGNSTPVFHANLELDVARNFTLAPFITYFSYQKYRHSGNRDYYYRNMVIPIGVKGTYYFDQLLRANSKWDFYLAGSIGFAYRSTKWEEGYTGDRTISNGMSGIYLDGHIGTEYHLNQKIGIVLDLSTGISTLCLAVHL